MDAAETQYASTLSLLLYIESADYNRGNYWKSGVAAGNIEKLLIGPPDVCSVPALPEGTDGTAAA